MCNIYIFFFGYIQANNTQSSANNDRHKFEFDDYSFVLVWFEEQKSFPFFKIILETKIQFNYKTFDFNLRKQKAFKNL